jgi:uncharacterized membrane protein YhaH (DUF805 family)
MLGAMDTDWTDSELWQWLTGGVGLVIAIALWLLLVIAYIRVIQKAGYSGWWMLLGLIPVVNVIMFLVFAFARWPALRELDELRARAGQGQRLP